jgi:5-methylcytosine-specific restriction endonuclease McrA
MEKLKICTKCGGAGPFGKKSKSPDGLRSRCKQCTNEDNREFYHSDIEYSREYGRKKQENWSDEQRERRRTYERVQLSIEKKRQWSRQKYWRNIETSREKTKERNRKRRKENGERMRAVENAYFKKNPEKRHLKNAKCRAQRYAARGRASAPQIRLRMQMFGNKCSYCAVGQQEHIDHLIPIKLGGTNWPANLRPSCASCNHKKKAMPAKVWLERIRTCS